LRCQHKAEKVQTALNGERKTKDKEGKYRTNRSRTLCPTRTSLAVRSFPETAITKAAKKKRGEKEEEKGEASAEPASSASSTHSSRPSRPVRERVSVLEELGRGAPKKKKKKGKKKKEGKQPFPTPPLWRLSPAWSSS